MKFFKRLAGDERGASAVEMGLILGLIVIVMFTALASLGNEVTNSFNSTAAKVKAAANTPSS